MKKLLKYLGWALVLLLVGFSFFILKPMHYQVPPVRERAGTHYWDMKTGSHIAYIVLPGKGEKKPYPVIYLQGGPGGPVYDRNIEALRPLTELGYDIYLYDQLGCGLSTRLDDIEGYTVERHEQDLAEIIGKIDAEKVILIGQSWGSILAINYMSDHCSSLDRVILTGLGQILPVNHALDTIQAPDSMQLRKPLVTNRQISDEMYGLRARFVEYCAVSFGWKLASDAEMDAFSSYLNNRMGKSTVCDTTVFNKNAKLTGGSGYYSMIRTLASFSDTKDKRTKLKNCSVPVLLMRGQCDGVRWGYISEYLELLANPTLVIIPGAGHSIPMEQPHLYMQTIKEFLSK